MLRIEDAYAYLVQRTARLLRRNFLRITKAAGLDLTPEQWFVLNKLRQRDGQSQGELGDAILEDRPNMTRMLKSMEQKGLIKRSADPTDGRRVRVQLTRRGRAAHDAMSKAAAVERPRVYAGLDAVDFVALKKILDTINHNLERADG